MWPQTHHGTYSRYQQHRRAGEQPCDLCRLANNAYTNLYRWNHEQARIRQAKAQRRRADAVAELIQRHRAEYSSILIGLNQQEINA